MTSTQCSAYIGIYIDTEFTSLNNPRLISIGAVTEDGREFYGVATDYPRRSCSRFVIDHVLPVLGYREPHVEGGSSLLASSLRTWLKTVAGDRCQFIVDDEVDAHLLMSLLRHAVFSAEISIISMDTDSAARKYFERWFLENPEMHRHNALDDARAYRNALLSISER